MTRACLRWAVLMAALGSALLLATKTDAQICTDYYRFGPTYSSVCPFVDGCMEEYGEEPADFVTVPGSLEENQDLSGRVFVAVINDATEEDSDESQDECNDCVDPQADDVSPSECNRYCGDYYGYGEFTADDREMDLATESNDGAADASDSYDLKHHYADYIDSQNAQSTHPVETAEELVEAETTDDIWDETDSGHDYDDSCLYDYPCNPEDNTHLEELANEPAADQVDELADDDSCQSVQPFDAYGDDSCGYEYNPACHQDYESDETTSDDESSDLAAQESGEDAEEPESSDGYDTYDYDYDYYRGCYDEYGDECADESSNVVEPDVVEQAADDYEAYDDYDYGYDDDYDYDYDRYDEYGRWQEEPVADESSEVVESDVVEQTADEYEAYDDYDYGYDDEYDYDYDRYDEYGRWQEEPVADESSEVVESDVVEQAADEYEAYDEYDYGYDDEYDYDYDRYDEYDSWQDEPAVDESSEVVESDVVEQAADEYEAYDEYDYGYDDEYDYDYDRYDEYDSWQDEPAVDESSEAVESDVVEQAADENESNDEYDYGYDDEYDYDYDRYDEYGSWQDEPAVDESSEAVESDVVEPVTEESEPHDAYDYEYGYEYEYDSDYDTYDEYDSWQEESVTDDTSDVTPDAHGVSEEADIENSDAYESYGYDYGYGYEEFEETQEEPMVDDSSEEGLEPDADEAAEYSESYDSDPYDYETSEYESYDYESYEYEPYEYQDYQTDEADESSSKDEPAADAAEVSEPATESASEYDMHEMYEYDYYEPYDVSPTDAVNDESVEAGDDDSCGAFDHGSEVLQGDSERDSEVDQAQESDFDQQYYGRYPYGYGYGYEYDYEYYSSDAAETEDQGDSQVSTPVTFDFERVVDLGRRLAESLSAEAIVLGVQARFVSLRQHVSESLAKVDFVQLRARFIRSVMAMAETDSGLSGNVFLFEFTMEDAGSVDQPITLDETPWMVEDVSSVEPVDLTSLLPGDDVFALVSDWAGIALAKLSSAWVSLAPELERIAVETMAHASLVEPSTTQR